MPPGFVGQVAHAVVDVTAVLCVPMARFHAAPELVPRAKPGDAPASQELPLSLACCFRNRDDLGREASI